MARKNVNTYLVAPAQSLAAAFTTAPTLIKYMDNCSYQINITTADSTGTFTVEVSDDFAMNEPTNLVVNPGKWAALPLGATPPTAGGADDTISIDMNQLSFNAVRISYAPTITGTGVADIYITTRTVGA